jgi:hypothetical protein
VPPPTAADWDLWVEADSLGLSDNAAVASWADLSTNDNDLAQAVSGSRPIFKTNITPTGEPVVRFNDDDFFLEGSETMPTGNARVVIVACLATRTGSFANQSFVSWGDRAENEMVALESNQDGEDANFSGYGNDLPAAGVLTPGTFHVISMVWDLTDRYTRVDGVEVADGTFADKATAASVIRIGRPLNDGDGPFPGNFDLAGLLVGSTVNAVAAFADAEDYFTQKFIDAGVLVITPGLITDAPTLHNPTVNTGALTITPGLITDAPTLHNPTVNTGGTTTITPGLITDAPTLHNPTINAGSITITPGLISDPPTLHAPTVSAPTETVGGRIQSSRGDLNRLWQ